MEKTQVFEHPWFSGFPFIRLSDIKERSIIISAGIEEVVACSPVDADEGDGSYFNSVYEENGEIFIRTMMGRSDPNEDVWIYAGEDIKELKQVDPNYKKAKDLLDQSK